MTDQDSAFWQAFYAGGTRPGWDLQGPSPLLAELLEQVEALGLRPGPSIAVPGCGFGHDAAELARRGWQATGVDFAPAAVQGARDRYGDLAQWRQEDWFVSGPERFHCLFDYTCFVAMAPAQRPRYVEACAERLHPGGLWLGGFFHTVTGPASPPYPVAMAELRALAEPRFEVLHLDHAGRSHPRRAGREFLMVARRRG
jgi:SAM-dependent methyltransferase